MVSRGLCKLIGGGELEDVIDFLRRAAGLELCMTGLLNERAVEALGDMCRRLVDDRRYVEFVGVMENLAGHKLFLREVLDPMDMLKLLVENSKPKVAIRYANIFPNAILMLTAVMDEYGRRHDVESALVVYEIIKQKGGPNMFACRSIIDICGSCGDYLRSRSIFEVKGYNVPDGQFAELLAEKITPNTYVFNSLMNVNAHDLRYTLHLQKIMQHLGVVADMTSYNILLKACCSAKRVDLAQLIYREIKHMASKGVLELDVITYSTMIKLFADARMWQKAMKIKDDMLIAGVTPNIITWSSLIAACAKVGLVHGAIQTFEEMLLSGCEPNAHCCNSVLSACVEACQYDRAFRLFYAWKEKGFNVSNAVKGQSSGSESQSLIPENPVGTALCPSTCSSRGPQPLADSRLIIFRPTVATYNILMMACGTDPHRAKELMDEMKATGLSPNHISWSVLIDIYGMSKDLKGAMATFKTMRGAGVNLDVVAYTTAIKVCVENKSLKIAFSLFEEMKRYQVQPNLVTYNTLLKARSRYGSLNEVQQCLAVYQDMRKAGYSANDYYLKELIEEWCEGVICGGKEGQNMSSSCYSQNSLSKPYGLLLEKVAMYLHKDVKKSYAVDVRGLTKVEARIVVLSVLRMIKESYHIGKTIKDDLVVIFGTGSRSHIDVQNAIVKALQNELGLDVVTAPNSLQIGKEEFDCPDNARHSAALWKNKGLTKGQRYLTRRPQDLGLIKVTRKSLSHWLLHKKGQH